MEIGFGFISIILIYGVLYLIKYKLTFSETKGKTNQVHLPKIFFWVGFIGVGFYTSMLILTLFFPKVFINFTWGVAVIIFFIISLGLSLIIAYYNCRIDISKNEFVYHTFFGRSYKFLYTDIKRVRRTNNTIHLYTDKKHLYIDKHANGLDEFMTKF